MKAQAFVQSLGALAILAAGALLAAGVAAEERPVPDTFTAVTTNMQPADVELKADILAWSTAEQRQQVIAALAAVAFVPPITLVSAPPCRRSRGVVTFSTPNSGLWSM